MAAEIEKKKMNEGRRILDKHIGAVTAVIKANPTNFFMQLVENFLVSSNAYDPEHIVLDKEQQALRLYSQCGAAVGIASSNFSKVVDVLSGYPLLDQVVEKMKSEGKNAGLIVEESPETSASQEDVDLEAEEFNATIFEISGGEEQIEEWPGHGLRLKVPENALPAGTTSRVTVKERPDEDFELPENLTLISDVYQIAVSQPFKSFVTLYLEHSAVIRSKAQSSGLQFVAGKCTQSELPCQLKTLKGGVFPPHTNEAHICIKQLSMHIAVSKKKPPNLFYYQQIFYREAQGNSPWQLHFLLTRSDKYQLVMNQYKTDHWTLDGRQTILFDEPEDSSLPSITLKVLEAEDKEQENWVIRPSGGGMLLKDEVDGFKKEMPVPVCQITIKWNGKSTPVFPEVFRRVKLVGAKHPNDHFLIELPELCAKSPPLRQLSKQKSEVIYYQQVFFYREFQSNATPWQFHFVLTPHDKCSLVTNKYNEMDGWTSDNPQPVQFDEPQDEALPSITLRVEEAEDDEQKDWFIRLSGGGMLLKDVVDRFEKEMPLPICKFTIRWKGKKQPPVFPEVFRRVKLVGARPPNDHFYIDLPEQTVKFTQ